MASAQHPVHDGFWPAAPAAAGTRRDHTYHQYALAHRAPAATTVAFTSDPPCPA